ncbi:MAG: hypothetical protein BGO55_13660 [Sphingobacteriales bacterium 50-39]|nr:hypothetical protein [Sphingobacteriales bacterium]OJW57343.1 MAG: hypothetical protein BGO55_13660 [Sphingobacteriales bacterium 50-39]
MADKFYSGSWEGYYSHGAGYDEERQKIKVGFYVKMVLHNGILTGTCEEYVTKVHMWKAATLTGSIEGELIRFVKQYPYYYEIDEQNNIQIDRTRAADQVHYWGSFDRVIRAFSGTWGIDQLPGTDGWEENDYLFSGSWSMTRA